MKETGVVRRLDELGRVVIPKEIRKRLKINNGDMVDIYTSDEQIILEKYHLLNQDITAIKAYLDTVYNENNCHLILFDESKVLYSTDERLKIGEVISTNFIKRIDSYLDKEISHMLNLEIVDNVLFDKDLYISRIVINYENYGYICIIDQMITKKQKDILNTFIVYLNNLLSE